MTCDCPTCGQPLPESGVIFDIEACIIVADGQFLHLTSTEFEVVFSLWQADGRTLRRERLQDLLYGLSNEAEPDIKIVDVYVCNIRKKLKNFPLSIETCRARGYRIVLRPKEQS